MHHLQRIGGHIITHHNVLVPTVGVYAHDKTGLRLAGQFKTKASHSTSAFRPTFFES